MKWFSLSIAFLYSGFFLEGVNIRALESWMAKAGKRFVHMNQVKVRSLQAPTHSHIPIRLVNFVRVQKGPSIQLSSSSVKYKVWWSGKHIHHDFLNFKDYDLTKKLNALMVVKTSVVCMHFMA